LIVKNRPQMRYTNNLH